MNCGRRSRGAARRRGTGFTLIEVLVVVVLTALLAAAASFILLHTVRRATAQDVLRRLAELDSLTRQAARRSGHAMTLVFTGGTAGDEHGIVARQQDADGHDTGTVVRLPPGARLERVWVWPAEVRQGVRPVDWGDAAVTCSRLGLTPTYGFELVGLDGRHYWRLVAGLTGVMSEATDEADLLQTFDALAGRSIPPP